MLASLADQESPALPRPTPPPASDAQAASTSGRPSSRCSLSFGLRRLICVVLDWLGHPLFLLLEFPLLLHRRFYPHRRLLFLEEPALLAVGVVLALLGFALSRRLVTLSPTLSETRDVPLVLHLRRLSCFHGGIARLGVSASSGSASAICASAVSSHGPCTAESLTTFSSFAHQTPLSFLTTFPTLHTFLSHVTFLAYGGSSLPFSLLPSSMREDDTTSSDTPSTSGAMPSPSEPTHHLRARPRPPPNRYSPTHYGLFDVLEPTSYRDAVTHPEWQLAMAEEIAALERTGTWDIVAPPSSVRPITCKWVYKVKTRSDGSLQRYKARLVARGFQQEHGRDYDETFAPVPHMTTVRTLLVVASVRRWSVSQLDVQNAFLNGELHEEVYMQPPPGYSIPDGMVCRLRRSLYGLKQAPRAWFQRFTSVVTSAGFVPSAHDPALFVPTYSRGRTLLLLYVDDMIITGDNPEYIAFVKARLRDQFLMTDFGPLHYFLGLEVSSTSDGFYISQEKYIQDLLTRAALGDERTVETPMELNVHLRSTDGDPLPDP
ncbi:hypothetical protein QYE76_051829 [Lolium multiflorum]|uniref:Reverse transcriptase Ty1/copia-type domain-containing protein n=1 Tax=Lolium multiflorum TaxID=4521 RepID=A0AAD8WKX9_LOLMU|nr:hypothetical protein QYE76_051829 [Lolium multiflorum]